RARRCAAGRSRPSRPASSWRETARSSASRAGATFRARRLDPRERRPHDPKRRASEGNCMTINVIRHAKFGALFAAALGLAGQAQGQTAVKFSLDWKYEGTQAPFLLALDRGYFKGEGLDVTIDTAGGSVEPINRIASRTY